MYSQYPGPYDFPPGPPVPASADGGATAALVLGICGIMVCGLLGPVALFLGMSARKRIRASGGYLSGDGQATAGIILGAITTAILALAVVAIAIVVIIAASNSH